MTREPPYLAADCVVFDGEGRLLLVRRKEEPFAGRYALPGGFIEAGETSGAAALRELKEETGIEGRVTRLVGVYSDPKRDPRAHTISVAYLIEPTTFDVVAGDDAAEAAFVADWREQKLAFDHADIVRDALKRG